MQHRSTRVLSLNSYIMGHATYQNTLEYVFDQHIPEVEFKSLHLNDYDRHYWLARLLFKVLSRRFIASVGDYEFHRFRVELVNSLYARHCLKKHLSAYQPDVLHIHTQGLALAPGSLFQRYPTVVSIDYTTALLAKEHPSPAHITYQPIIALEKKCFQTAAHIVSCSARARRSVIADYQIAPEKVTHIDYPLKLDQFSALQPVPKSESIQPRLLFIGNDFVRKGGEDLLAVFLEQFADRCHLDLVTNAAITVPNLENLRVHRGLKPLSDKLVHLLQTADIFVMPTHEDVYGIVFQEAMAAGLPCIGTTVMAVPELVQHGQTGLTVPPGDRPALTQAIQTLVKDPQLRWSMGLTGRAIAKQRFDPIINGQRLGQIFSRCAQSRLVKG